MKIRHLKSGAVENVSYSYGLRLIEQGKAVPAVYETERKPITRQATEK